jgi:hypothetical protein
VLIVQSGLGEACQPLTCEKMGSQVFPETVKAYLMFLSTARSVELESTAGKFHSKRLAIYVGVDVSKEVNGCAKARLKHT